MNLKPNHPMRALPFTNSIVTLCLVVLSLTTPLGGQQRDSRDVRLLVGAVAWVKQLPAFKQLAVAVAPADSSGNHRRFDVVPTRAAAARLGVSIVQEDVERRCRATATKGCPQVFDGVIVRIRESTKSAPSGVYVTIQTSAPSPQRVEVTKFTLVRMEERPNGAWEVVEVLGVFTG
jgi:hypothetical protein